MTCLNLGYCDIHLRSFTFIFLTDQSSATRASWRWRSPQQPASATTPAPGYSWPSACGGAEPGTPATVCSRVLTKIQLASSKISLTNSWCLTAASVPPVFLARSTYLMYPAHLATTPPYHLAAMDTTSPCRAHLSNNKTVSLLILSTSPFTFPIPTHF